MTIKARKVSAYVDPEGIMQFPGSGSLECSKDARTGNEDRTKGEPEATIRSKSFGSTREHAAGRRRRVNGLPVAPKVLPQANSHIPARSWQRPPTPRAIPTTTFGFSKARK